MRCAYCHVQQLLLPPNNKALDGAVDHGGGGWGRHGRRTRARVNKAPLFRLQGNADGRTYMSGDMAMGLMGNDVLMMWVVVVVGA